MQRSHVLPGSDGRDQEGQEEKAAERRHRFCISGPHSPQPLQSLFGFKLPRMLDLAHISA